MGATLIVSIYAAVVSTVVFLWRLYEFYDDKKGKIKLSLGISTQTLVVGNKVNPWQEMLVVTITNVGKHRRQVERPMFETDIPVNNQSYMNAIDLKDTTRFPYVLEPGDKFEYKIELSAFKDKLQNTNVKKLKAHITDTHKKSYVSNWLKV